MRKKLYMLLAAAMLATTGSVYAQSAVGHGSATIDTGQPAHEFSRSAYAKVTDLAATLNDDGSVTLTYTLPDKCMELDGTEHDITGHTYAGVRVISDSPYKKFKEYTGNEALSPGSQTYTIAASELTKGTTYSFYITTKLTDINYSYTYGNNVPLLIPEEEIVEIPTLSRSAYALVTDQESVLQDDGSVKITFSLPTSCIDGGSEIQLPGYKYHTVKIVTYSPTPEDKTYKEWSEAQRNQATAGDKLEYIVPASDLTAGTTYKFQIVTKLISNSYTCYNDGVSVVIPVEEVVEPEPTPDPTELLGRYHYAQITDQTTVVNDDGSVTVGFTLPTVASHNGDVQLGDMEYHEVRIEAGTTYYKKWSKADGTALRAGQHVSHTIPVTDLTRGQSYKFVIFVKLISNSISRYTDGIEVFIPLEEVVEEVPTLSSSAYAKVVEETAVAQEDGSILVNFTLPTTAVDGAETKNISNLTYNNVRIVTYEPDYIKFKEYKDDEALKAGQSVTYTIPASELTKGTTYKIQILTKLTSSNDTHTYSTGVDVLVPQEEVVTPPAVDVPDDAKAATENAEISFNQETRQITYSFDVPTALEKEGETYDVNGQKFEMVVVWRATCAEGIKAPFGTTEKVYEARDVAAGSHHSVTTDSETETHYAYWTSLYWKSVQGAKQSGYIEVSTAMPASDAPEAATAKINAADMAYEMKDGAVKLTLNIPNAVELNGQSYPVTGYRFARLAIFRQECDKDMKPVENDPTTVVDVENIEAGKPYVLTDADVKANTYYAYWATLTWRTEGKQGAYLLVDTSAPLVEIPYDAWAIPTGESATYNAADNAVTFSFMAPRIVKTGSAMQPTQQQSYDATGQKYDHATIWRYEATEVGNVNSLNYTAGATTLRVEDIPAGQICSAVDTNVEPGKIYAYLVYLYWRDGSGKYQGSNYAFVECVAGAVDAHPAVTELKAALNDDNTVAQLTWKAPAGEGVAEVSGYNVYVGGTKVNEELVTECAYSYNVPADAETLSFTVEAVYADGETATCDAYELTVKVVIPDTAWAQVSTQSAVYYSHNNTVVYRATIPTTMIDGSEYIVENQKEYDAKGVTFAYLKVYKQTKKEDGSWSTFEDVKTFDNVVAGQEYEFVDEKVEAGADYRYTAGLRYKEGVTGEKYGASVTVSCVSEQAPDNAFGIVTEHSYTYTDADNTVHVTFTLPTFVTTYDYSTGEKVEKTYDITGQEFAEAVLYRYRSNVKGEQIDAAEGRVTVKVLTSDLVAGNSFTIDDQDVERYGYYLYYVGLKWKSGAEPMNVNYLHVSCYGEEPVLEHLPVTNLSAVLNDDNTAIRISWQAPNVSNVYILGYNVMIDGKPAQENLVQGTEALYVIPEGTGEHTFKVMVQTAYTDNIDVDSDVIEVAYSAIMELLRETPDLEIYTLNGVRVKNPTPGMYIIRKGGATYKVYVK